MVIRVDAVKVVHVMCESFPRWVSSLKTQNEGIDQSMTLLLLSCAFGTVRVPR